ncbi:hypothetical protein OG462_09070 [Streptomyces sp. NBC_01077]|uniref:hypothetical protein n=1 Tax=Streptomyces sp. NBC_01077 TaxID=2903746 RepID=UPI003865F6D4|nr:hypothetical protein OG462_09070 [Streptomyces sp. NBC_01077]
MAVGNVQITGTGQLLDLSRSLRAAGGPRLAQNFTRRIRRAAEPLYTDLQDSIRSTTIQSPGRGQGSRGGSSPTTRPLRESIAGAIRLSVRASANPGARLWVDKSRLPSDLRNMAATINSGRIRHPVYGNRRRWVTQTASPPWWDSVVTRHQPRMRAEVERVLGDVRRTIT